MLARFLVRSQPYSLAQTAAKSSTATSSVNHTILGQLSAENLNPQVTGAEFAVRGRVLQRSFELQKQMKKDPSSLPFTEFVECNVGNPHNLGQSPITFNREVLSLAMFPTLLSDAHIEMTRKQFSPDAITRAQKYLGMVPSMGSYTHSQGLAPIREEIAEFIEARDQTGKPVDPENIFITNGASEGVKTVLQTLIRPEPMDGILVPIPQYPLYSATITTLNGSLVPYFLDEKNQWGLNIEGLKEHLQQAREAGTAVRGLVVINPGNPTGQTLTRKNMEEIISLCAEENIVCLADEVYQENIWNFDHPFHSFRQVASEMGYSDDPESSFELISFHSISKGFLGECGIRGGYFELFGIHEDVRKMLYKLSSISLCPNTPGQVMTGLMVNPPQPNDPSFALYDDERSHVLESLRRRAFTVAEALDALPGITCRPSDGALYAFPRIELPDKFMREAESKHIPPDELYCLRLLESTGLQVVPGSGFGQEEGTWHFRTTFLPPEDKIEAVFAGVARFHLNLLEEYK